MADKAGEKRCPWCRESEIYIEYHDKEWGVPCRDPKELFELINLEGAQAGLSWITILNKRQGYRRLFADFDPVKIARFTDAKLDKIASDPSIVRHRGKVAAVKGNAQAWLALQKSGTPFDEFIWSFIDNKTKQNNFKTMKSVPASTDESLAMSKALKKLGFKFVGPTICYAFMQAAGLVNDHLVSCPRHKAVKKLG